MAYTKYSLTPANNNATPPDGAPEGMLPSAVNDTMRDMMAQIRDVGDGIRNGTYTMTAPVITGGSITGVALSGNTFTNPVITGGSINNTPIGASTASTGAFTTLSASGATTFSGATVVSGSLTANTFSSSGATITGGSINSTAIGGTTAAAGKFTTLEATGVTTVQAGTVSAPAITTSGDTNTGIFFPAADTIAFTEGGVESMRIDSSGNVGIGTSSPSERLEISGSGNQRLKITNTTAGASASLWLASNSKNAYVYNNDGVLNVYNGDASSPTVFSTNATERMRIDSSGNVGIGTSSPTGKLDVVSGSSLVGRFYNNAGRGIVRVDGSSDSSFQAYHNGSLIGSFQTDGSGTEITTGTNGSHPFIFYTNSTERMRITSAGNVGIGNTGDTSYRLYVTTNGSSQSAIATQGVSGDVGTQAILVTKFDNNTTTSQNFIQFQVNNGGANSGKITANGANAATFTSTSDERVKENIVDLPSQLSNICALRPKEFDYVASEGGGHQIGFIAQEMQQVYPDVVSEQKNGMLQISGWSKTEARLVKAIQEMKAIIDEQAARISALENK